MAPRGNGLAARQFRRLRRPKIPNPHRCRGEDVWLGLPSLSVETMSEVSRILSAVEQGDPRAAEQLLPLVYEELR